MESPLPATLILQHPMARIKADEGRAGRCGGLRENKKVRKVCNRADVAGAKIVWARDITGKGLEPLLDYFRRRQVLSVEPELAPPRLTPFSDLHHDH